MFPLLDLGLKRRQLLLLTVASFVLVSSVQGQVERTPRDGWQKVGEIFAAMAVSEGSRVADVGAGGGFLTVRLSQAIGERGMVYAEDINERVVRELERQIENLALHNVRAILGEVDDPRLPVSDLDAVVIVNSYHEMDHYEGMLAGIRRSLRPGGRLVIVDNPPRDTTASRDSQMRAHDIHIGLVEQDLRAAGYEVLERRPDFIDTGTGRGQHQQWMLVAVKPD